MKFVPFPGTPLPTQPQSEGVRPPRVPVSHQLVRTRGGSVINADEVFHEPYFMKSSVSVLRSVACAEATLRCRLSTPGLVCPKQACSPREALAARRFGSLPPAQLHLRPPLSFGWKASRGFRICFNSDSRGHVGRGDQKTATGWVARAKPDHRVSGAVRSFVSSGADTLT